MKDVSINSRIKEIKDGNRDFVMVDLIVDGETLETGSNPIESHSFWKDIEESSQRALKRIEDGNPTMKFDFNLATMGSTPESRRLGFIRHMSNQLPRLDINKFMEVAEAELIKLKLTGPDDGEHPNPFMKFPVDGDLVKMIMANVLDIYMNGPKPEEEPEVDQLNGEPNWELIQHLSIAPDSQLDASMTTILKELISNKESLTNVEVANKLLYVKDMCQYAALSSSIVIKLLHLEWERIGGTVEADNANCKWRNEF